LLDLERVPRLLPELVSLGFGRAGEHLARLLGRPIQLAAPEVRLMPLAAAAGMFGGEETEVVAVLSAFSGDLWGEALLVLDRGRADHLVDLCLGPGWRAGELATSVLSEVGNVATASFLNALADRFGLTVHVSPPDVVVDMAGAVLGTLLPLVEVLPDRVLLARTEFRESGVDVSGSFLLLPGGDALERMVGFGAAAVDA
jgi:chemotaxis protein CheC